MNATSRPPITDSPWFWLYVFGTAGILALLATSTKFGARQSQLDRQFEGRRHATAQPSDLEAERPFSSPGERIQSLRPLYIVLTVALLGGWVALWWQRYRPGAAAGSTGPDTESATESVADSVMKSESNRPTAGGDAT